jgi:phenylalanyl-tRNA synthetase beta subunit
MEATEQERNQREFREILAKHGLTQAQAAALITKETFKNIKERTLRTWLANSEAASSRSCPLWAIMALKKALAKPQSTTT